MTAGDERLRDNCHWAITRDPRRFSSVSRPSDPRAQRGTRTASSGVHQTRIRLSISSSQCSQKPATETFNNFYPDLIATGNVGNHGNRLSLREAKSVGVTFDCRGSKHRVVCPSVRHTSGETRACHVTTNNPRSTGVHKSKRA